MRRKRERDERTWRRHRPRVGAVGRLSLVQNLRSSAQRLLWKSTEEGRPKCVALSSIQGRRPALTRGDRPLCVVFLFRVAPIFSGRGLFLQYGGNSASYCCATKFASEGERIEGYAARKLSVVLLRAVLARQRTGDATSPVYYRTEPYTRNTYLRESLPVVTGGLRSGRRGVS